MLCKTPTERAHAMMKQHGYARGGGVDSGEPAAKKVVRKGVRQHETAEHGGEHHALKLRRGGHVPGDEPMDRPDRRARGGGVKPKIGSVNVIVGKGGGDAEKQQAMQQGMQIGAHMAAAKMGAGAGGPPRPPMPPPGGGMPPRPMGAPMGPGGPPPGGAPMPPHPMPQMAAHGGRIVRRDERGRWRGGVA